MRQKKCEILSELEGVPNLPAMAEAENVELVRGEEAAGAVELGYDTRRGLDGRAVVFEEEDEVGLKSLGDLGHAFRDAAVGRARSLEAEFSRNRPIRVIEVLKPDHGLIHGLSEICRTMSLKSGAQSIVRSPRDNSQTQR